MQDWIRTQWRALMFWLFGFVHLDELGPALEHLRELRGYVHSSGHLSNGFRAGQRIKRSLRDLEQELEAVQGGEPGGDHAWS